MLFTKIQAVASFHIKPFFNIYHIVKVHYHQVLVIKPLPSRICGLIYNLALKVVVSKIFVLAERLRIAVSCNNPS